METQYIYAILAGLAVLFLVKKNKATEAQAENLEAKEKINEVQKDIIESAALLNIETQKRTQLQAEMQKKKDEGLSEQEIADFFNNRK